MLPQRAKKYFISQIFSDLSIKLIRFIPQIAIYESRWVLPKFTFSDVDQHEMQRFYSLVDWVEVNIPSAHDRLHETPM